MAEPPIGLRQRKKQARRTALREIAWRMAIEHGLDGVTVEGIARAADVSPRTFFNYFSSKEEAVVDRSRANALALVDAFRARPRQEDLVTAMHTVARQILDENHEVSREWLRRSQLMRESPSLRPHILAAHSAVERSLAEAIAERSGTDVDADLYPMLAAVSILGAWRVAGTRWAENGASSLSELMRAALEQLAAGMATPLPGTVAGAAT
ncbi:MAG: TetR/AcrR family transcriptional regulator [Sciscionella sp.]